MNKGILYIIATPIGNLSDITLRALETLKAVDLIACEDTRVTVKLLNHYNIKKPLVSFHQHSRLQKINYILDEIAGGKSVALVTDAGTPGISDPGNVLVEEAVKRESKVVPIPGPAALTAITSVAGVDMQRFVFLGFPPHKKGRETYFRNLNGFEIPVVYYESPHRLIKNLELLSSINPQKRLIVGRELTKIFEEYVRGNIADVLKEFSQRKAKIKGEIVIIAY